MIRVLLATPDPEIAARARALLSELAEAEIVATADHAGEVTRMLADDDVPIDVAVLHDELGPLPVLDLAREVNHRFPQVGVLVLARETGVEQLRAAMSAGVRSIVRLPLMLSELHGAIVEANEWAQTVQSRLAAAGPAQRSTSRGRVVAVTGAKGGVGTTTVAVQLALAFKRQDPDRSVCLVDLDLQTGDVRAFLDVSHRRSIVDLIEVASELTTGHINDAMFPHPAGVRVLLPPVRGEDAEDLDGTTVARILGGIRSRFDTVVIDAGSLATEATVVAIEQADDVLLVCTPDVVALRGANRVVDLWDRLAVRDAGVRVVLNRASRDREVQPGLAERVLTVPVLDTVIPDRVLDVEAATNAGDPARLTGAVASALDALAAELGGDTPREAEEPEPREARESALAARVASETGALSAEFGAMLLPLLLTLLLIWQLVLAGYTTVLANQAANDAARVLSLEGNDPLAIQQAAESRLHGHWRRTVQPRVTSDHQIEISLPVPILVPGTSTPWRVRTSVAAIDESAMGPSPSTPGGTT